MARQLADVQGLRYYVEKRGQGLIRMHRVLTHWSYGIRVALVCVAVVLGGCESNIPARDAPTFTAAPAAPEGYATLYIFRLYESDYGQGVWPVLFLNDVKVSAVKAASFTYVYALPGEYKVRTEKNAPWSGMENYPYAFSIPSTANYYLEYSTGVSKMMTLAAGGAFIPLAVGRTSHEGWLIVPEQDALQKLPQTRYLSPFLQTVGH